MRYDLLLQSPDPLSTPYDVEAVNAVFKSRALVDDPSGAKRWKLKNGEVEVRPLNEGGKLIATEIRVPLSDKLELIREVVAEAAMVASEAKVRLFDPQLSRSLTAVDDTAVADQFFRTAKYAGEMMGVTEAIGASFSPPKQGMSISGKVILALVIFFLILYFIADRLMGQLGGK